MRDVKVLPQWAPRVPKSKIKRLYDLDAKGIYDWALIDDVGYSLRSRCKSFITACQATSGKASCPVCETIIPHQWDKSEILVCRNCDWQLTWGEYFATIQHKQLSGAEPVLELFQEFVDAYPKAKNEREKMIHIDRLLHGFHWHINYGPTRPVAINLLEGRLRDVILFLDQLSYGPGSTIGIVEQKVEWDRRCRNARGWALNNKHTE
jgi:ribosomal protein L37AE/L43A